MSAMTMAGATPMTRSSALVDGLAPIATLIATMMARVVHQLPTTHEREMLFNMVPTLLRVCPEMMARRSAGGRVCAPGHASDTCRRHAAARPPEQHATAIALLSRRVQTDERLPDVAWALGSRARSGPVGAHPKKGGTARTLAGSVRYDEIHYTRIGDVAFLRHLSPARILESIEPLS